MQLTTERYIAVPEKGAILLDPKLLRGISPSLFPKRKVVDYKDRKWVAVPLDSFSHALLTRQGLTPPHPMDTFYTWPGRFTPFKHQRVTAKFLADNQRGFCFNGMGSGKTQATIWALDYLMSQGICKKAIIVAPLSTLERVWADALFESMHHRKFAVLHGSRAKRLKQLESDADFYIINHDGLKVLHDELKAKKEITHYVVDESAVFRNHSTDRYKALWRLAGPETQKSLWLLTGAPMPNAPTDMWAQARLVNPNLVPKYFSRFRHSTMSQITQFKWVPKRGWEDMVYSMLKPQIRYATDDCIDLPPSTTSTREVAMSPQQAKAYKSLMKDMVAESKEGKIVAVNEAVKLGKLLQVAVGTVYTSDGERQAADLMPKAKLSELSEIVAEAGSKAIVFTPFKSSLKMLEKHLKQTYSVGVVSGDTGTGKRNQLFTDFQSGDLQILLAHPQCMAHGLTLTASATVVWYAPIDNFEIYDQANHRIRRPGQKLHQNIIHLLCTDVERAIYKRLENKEKIQGLLLDLLKSQ